MFQLLLFFLPTIFAIMHIFYVLRANLSFFIEKKQKKAKNNQPRNIKNSVSWLSLFLFLNGKFELQAAFGQIAHSDGTSMQKDGILDDSET